MKKALKINTLEVKSFVTGLTDENSVKGGVVITEWCTQNFKLCQNTADYSCQTQAPLC